MKLPPLCINPDLQFSNVSFSSSPFDITVSKQAWATLLLLQINLNFQELNN